VKRLFLIASFLTLFTLVSSGCDSNLQNLFHSSTKNDGKELIKAEIVFTDGERLEGYIKDLGIESDGKMYVGGSSLNYIYDADGNVVGSYNYQRVLYIKILPEKKDEKQ